MKSFYKKFTTFEGNLEIYTLSKCFSLCDTNFKISKSKSDDKNNKKKNRKRIVLIFPFQTKTSSAVRRNKSFKFLKKYKRLKLLA